MESGILDHIIVSTEDAEVAEEAKKLGLDVPFMRPEYLAQDPAGVVDVALHALSEIRKLGGGDYQTLVIMLPTCPFRLALDIQAAYRQFVEEGAKFLMSVSPYPHTPFAALNLDGGLLEPFFPDFFDKKSQELPVAYRPNGAIHILDVHAFEKERSYSARPLHGYIMPLERSIDIDTAHDLNFAESTLHTNGHI